MKCEKKGNLVNRQVTVGQEDLEQINRLTRREFSQEELYCFRVVLCDNDVDRQMERFDEETLEQLARMFVGKTGICDHQPKTANQLARIYQAQVEYSGNQSTGRTVLRSGGKSVHGAHRIQPRSDSGN